MEYLSDNNVSEISQWNQDSYWWYVIRQSWLEDAVHLAHARGNLSPRMVDLGCGTGIVIRQMCRKFKFDFVRGLEGDPRLLEVAREQGLPAEHLDLEGDISLPVKPDLWFCLDVLEHVKDHERVVESIHRASAPGALFCLTVPAHPMLYSDWDRQSGHYRRYTRRALRRLLNPKQWRILKLTHFFSFLVPVVFARRVMMSEEQKVPQVSPTLNRILTSVGMLERSSPVLPFGTSLYCIAEAV